VKLEALAGEMRRQLSSKARGWLHQALMRGLHVVLERRDAEWRLALGRERVFPSAQEVEICMDAFKVPLGTEQVRVEPERRQAQSARRYQGYFVVELRWREVDSERV